MLPGCSAGTRVLASLYVVFSLVTPLGCAGRHATTEPPQRPGEVAVVVKDETGAPLAGVNVTILWLAAQQFAMVRTDASGRAAIEIPNFTASDLEGDLYRYRLVLGLSGYETQKEERSLENPPRGAVRTFTMPQNEDRTSSSEGAN